MGFVKQMVNIIFNKTKKDNSRGKLTFNGSKRILHNDQGQVNCPESGKFQFVPHFLIPPKFLGQFYLIV